MIMRNKIVLFSIAGLLTISSSLLMTSCKKQGITTPNQEKAGFAKSSDSYFITNSPNSVYKIPVGITAIPNADRKLTFTVSSPSGAASGQQYNLGSTTITIPAGKTVDSISVKGLFGGYASGRKDTLIFKLTGGDVNAMSGSNQFTLYMQKYCPVDLTQFAGVYNIQDYYAGAPDGGPYTVTITPGTANGTTGYILISGIWGFDSPPVRVNLDWTNPANFTTSIPTAPWFVHPTYGQATIRPNGTGTFSSCDNKFTLSYETTVSAGSFGKEISVITK